MSNRRDRFIRAVGERIGWRDSLHPWLFKDLPPRTGWTATLGSLSLMIFATMFVSGVFLAMHYNPSPDKAYQSVDYIMQSVRGGWLLRGVHHWGASAMVIAVFLHMLTGFFSGAYKRPRELTWISGVLLLLIVLGLGFTGYLLPWDLKAYWATTVSTNIPKDIPIVGGAVSRLMLGGDNVSGATLTRFYAVHAMLLPALLVAVLAFHIYLVRVHGIAEEDASANANDGDANPAKPYRFYPEHAWRSAIVYGVGLLALIALSIFAHIPREEIAGTQVESYLPRPEWYYMWLFQLLTLFPGKWEWLGSLAIPFLLVTLLFVLPFLDRSRRMGVRNRPLVLAVGLMGIVGIAYLTAMGFAGAKPYGQTFQVPDRQLSATEQRGLFLYADRDCAYCHQVNGRGGHRRGPDLSNMVAKGRTREYLARYIRDPQSVDSGSVMPKYPLPDADLNALADFLLTLNHAPKTIPREQVLAQGVK